MLLLGALGIACVLLAAAALEETPRDDSAHGSLAVSPGSLAVDALLFLLCLVATIAHKRHADRERE